MLSSSFIWFFLFSSYNHTRRRPVRHAERSDGDVANRAPPGWDEEGTSEVGERTVNGDRRETEPDEPRASRLSPSFTVSGRPSSVPFATSLDSD